MGTFTGPRRPCRARRPGRRPRRRRGDRVRRDGRERRVDARRQPDRREGRGDEGHHADHHPGADHHAAVHGLPDGHGQAAVAVRRPAGLRHHLGRQHRVGDHHEHVVHARPLPGEAEVPGRAGHARQAPHQGAAHAEAVRARIPGIWDGGGTAPATRWSRPRPSRGGAATPERDDVRAPPAFHSSRQAAVSDRDPGGLEVDPEGAHGSDVEVLGLEPARGEPRPRQVGRPREGRVGARWRSARPGRARPPTTA